MYLKLDINGKVKSWQQYQCVSLEENVTGYVEFCDIEGHACVTSVYC